MKKIVILSLLISFFFTPLLIAGCKESRNPVLNYFTNAELQYEGKEQKENIMQALTDILTLSEGQLNAKRYSDYTGKEKQWDLKELIKKHFVPDSSKKTLGNNFYHDIKTREVQDEVKKILDKMK